MNLKKLDYFVTLVDAGNFSHAAEQLYITQPALSWNIKDLESSLKTELLVRSASGIELTETGSILYDGAKSLLEKAAQLERSIAIAQHHSKRKVRLGMTILSSIEYMDIFQYFASQYEEYQLDFVQRGSKEIQDMLAKSQLDIGIVSEPIYYPSLENTRRKLDDYYYEVAVVVSKDNPLSTEKSITFDMVKEEKLCLMTTGFAMGNEVEKRMLDLGIVPNVVFRNENWEVLVEHVSSYHSVTFLPIGIKDLLTRDDLVWIPLVDDKVARFNLSLISNLENKNPSDTLLLNRFYEVLTSTSKSR